jgi:hypothetical protein
MNINFQKIMFGRIAYTLFLLGVLGVLASAHLPFPLFVILAISIILIGIITEAAPLILSRAASSPVPAHATEASTDPAFDLSSLLNSTTVKSEQAEKFDDLSNWFATTALGHFK